MNNRLKIVFLLGLIVSQATAQVTTPGDHQSQPIAIINGYAHIGNGEVIEQSIITFNEGKIEQVMDARTSKIDLSGYAKIDATDKHIYPGLILIGKEIGLSEIGAVRASKDNKEVGSLNPNVRTAIAYNTDSEIIPTLRFNGIQIAQTVPIGGRIPGTSSVMQLDAWNWEDALYLEDDAVHLNWASMTRASKAGSGEIGRQINEKFESQKNEIIQLIKDTKSYIQLENKVLNLKLEAMSKVIKGEQRLFVRVNRAKDIQDAILTLMELEIPKVVLMGMRDIILVKGLVKKSGYPVVLDNLHRLPWREDTPIDEPYKLAKMVHEEGIFAAITYLTSNDFSSMRNLAFLAGTATAYGLDKEVALSMITLNAATVLEIEQRTGSIEVGKDANLLISEGDLLDMRTNQLVYSFIKGREVNLEGRQQRLYKKYKAKYD